LRVTSADAIARSALKQRQSHALRDGRYISVLAIKIATALFI
jgi:hypothetical protein